MENEAEILGSFQVEEKSVVAAVSEERIAERDVVGLEESKDLDDGDIFGEDMITPKVLQERVVEPDSGPSGSGGGAGNVKISGESGLQVVDGNANAEHGSETFEEAFEVPSVEARGIINGVNFVGGKGVDEGGVVEGGTEMEIETVELNGSRDYGILDGGENGGEKEVLEREDEVDLRSGQVVEKCANKDFDNVNFNRMPVDEKSENGGGDNVGGTITESLHETESSRKILHEDGNGEKLKDDNTSAECQGNGRGVLKDATTGIIPSQEDDSSDEPGGNSSYMDTDKVGGAITESLHEPESSRGILHQDGNSEKLKDDNLSAECQGNGSGVLKDATAGIIPSQEDDSSDEPGGISSCMDTDNQFYRNSKAKDIQAGVDSECLLETSELKDTSADLHALVEESSVVSVLASSPAAEVSKTKNEESFLGNKNDSRPETNKVSQLQDADEDVHEVSNNHAVVEGIMIKEENAGQQRAQVNGKQAIQPVPELASSSGKSSNHAPPARPAGLGRAAPLLEPAPRVVQQPRVNGSVSQMQTQQMEDPSNGESEEYDETREKLQMIRVKFLRLAHRLGQTPHNVVVAQVLYRLGLAEQLRGRNGGRVGAFSFDRASAMAEQLEATGQGQEPLDFSCTIMVLGKSGVGKSATINSIFDEVKFGTDAFQMGTKKVQDVVGTVQGIKVRVIDTPGLLPPLSDQRQNEKILHSVKHFIKKTPPDIVLYLDRLDMQSRDFSDMPLLRTITEIFGPSIWFNAIVVLTHAASAPPDGPNGTASSYDMFVTQRSHVVQQAIRQAAGDMRLMNPVSLVENHSACRTNRAGQRVLPNGQVWKPHLLLLSFASKILAEANALLKLQDSPPGKPFPNRTRAPPLPFLLSSLLQSRPQVKLPEEQFGDEDDLDDDLDDSSDSDEESELDELPPFKRLTKAQESRLSKTQKKAYLDELEYREKLFMKKQLKEEKKRRKMMKKMASSAMDLPGDFSENVEEESGGPASVPIPLPDYALPASFDSDNPSHRYRHLDSSNQWLIRPVLDTHGWDHDVGYEGINVERLFVVKEKIPLSFSSQVTKDKKDANVQLEVASSIKHGEGKATSLGFDMQTVGKDLAYTLRSETRFCNFRKNKAAAGLSVTLLGDALSAGLKIEDKLIANKRFQLVMTGGAMTARGDVAYGGSLEAQLRDKDHPFGRSLSTLGLSVMDWHGDLAIGCNLQSQIPVGRSSNLIARVNLNNRGAGQASIRLNSSEQIQLALVSLIPLLRKLHGYLQELQSSQ